MADLQTVIKRLRSADVNHDSWLYIAGDAEDLSLSTDADLGCALFDEELDDDIDPPDFVERGLWSTIDKETCIACIKWADRLSGQVDDIAAVDVIRYYIRFDAWPETLNAPDPPPADVTLLKLDQEFCDRLGEEDNSKKCRRDGCERGTIKMSVLCRRHHFETIRGRIYPFDN